MESPVGDNKQVKLHATLSLSLSLPPGHGFRAFAMRLGCQGSLKRLHVTVELCWVPADARDASGWFAPSCLTERRARDMNDPVDAAAHELVHQLWGGSERAKWHAANRTAQGVETRLLRTAISVY